MLGWMQREAAAERALKEAEEKRKRDEEAAEQARLVAERTAALQVHKGFRRVRTQPLPANRQRAARMRLSDAPVGLPPEDAGGYFISAGPAKPKRAPCDACMQPSNAGT